MVPLSTQGPQLPKAHVTPFHRRRSDRHPVPSASGALLKPVPPLSPPTGRSRRTSSSLASVVVPKRRLRREFLLPAGQASCSHCSSHSRTVLTVSPPGFKTSGPPCCLQDKVKVYNYRGIRGLHCCQSTLPASPPSMSHSPAGSSSNSSV